MIAANSMPAARHASQANPADRYGLIFDGDIQIRIICMQMRYSPRQVLRALSRGKMTIKKPLVSGFFIYCQTLVSACSFWRKG
jgi:hypothetical protein